MDKGKPLVTESSIGKEAYGELVEYLLTVMVDTGDDYEQALAASDPIALETQAMSEDEIRRWLDETFAANPLMLFNIKRTLLDKQPFFDEVNDG